MHSDGMAKKKPDPTPYYFPQRLQKRLAAIPDHALTVVEAPSGFGKTTAVREYFAATLAKSARQAWYTCLGESPEKAWSGICALLGGADPAMAEGLAALGVPAREPANLFFQKKSCKWGGRNSIILWHGYG